MQVCHGNGPGEAARALALADLLGLPLHTGEQPPPVEATSADPPRRRRARRTPLPWRLAVTADGLQLISPAGARSAPRFIDGRAATHAREAGLAAQPLARALGIASLRARLQRPVEVLDATAGYGTDAWLIAALGASVTLSERDPIIHALLQDALQRAHRLGDERTRAIACRLSLRNDDIADIAGSASSDDAERDAGVDLVYLDPMYPERRVRGGQRKQIDALQAIVGHDAHNAGLLDAALALARLRVIVKRPRGADPLHSLQGHRPNDTIDGPNTRYDRYLVRGISPGSS